MVSSVIVESDATAVSVYARSAIEFAAISLRTCVMSPSPAAPKMSVTVSSTLPTLPATEYTKRLPTDTFPLYNSLKFWFTLSNAVRISSPSPAPALEPKLIFC